MDLVLQTLLDFVKDAFGWDHMLISDLQRLVHPIRKHFTANGVKFSGNTPCITSTSVLKMSY